jgi:CheY-like chemotaxis protein
MTRTAHKRRVLVADDDPDMLALVASVLRAAGAQVVEAHDGADLLDLAANATDAEDNHFDAIFSDIQMPYMTPIDVMERLPILARHTPVILFTGVRDRTLRDKAYDLGVEAIIDKPLNPMDLIALMRFVTMRSEKGDANARN